MSDEPLSLKITLETVTPLFLAGADPRGEPELRPPSFRGALRYWLRAALGGVIGDQDIMLLHKLESAVFGSTEHGSPISIRVLHENVPEPEEYEHRSTRGSASPAPGREYLYWSMAQSGSRERGNYQPPRRYYPPGTRFDLRFGTLADSQVSEDSLQRALAAFWMMVQLGGIGSRSRRTAGSLSVVKKETKSTLIPSLVLASTNTKGASQELAAGLTSVRGSLSSTSPRITGCPSFDILHPSTCRVWVLGHWKDAMEAVDAIGASLRDFRSRREPDHRNVGQWLNGESIDANTIERAVFGLPITYRYSSSHVSGTVQAQAGREDIGRRASPLWLKISRIDGGYIGVATLFKSRLLPDGAKLCAKSKRGVVPLDPPRDYNLIECWIADSFPNSEEVVYE